MDLFFLLFENDDSSLGRKLSLVSNPCYHYPLHYKQCENLQVIHLLVSFYMWKDLIRNNYIYYLTSIKDGTTKNGLDPTEERILFGSEGNVWSAFGKSPNMNGEGGSPVDGEGLMNGLSSIQSGTWSALMHSAVVETSSSDLRVQEEWSGLIFQSTELPSGTQFDV